MPHQRAGRGIPAPPSTAPRKLPPLRGARGPIIIFGAHAGFLLLAGGGFLGPIRNLARAALFFCRPPTMILAVFSEDPSVVAERSGLFWLARLPREGPPVVVA